MLDARLLPVCVFLPSPKMGPVDRYTSYTGCRIGQMTNLRKQLALSLDLDRERAMDTTDRTG